MIKRSIQELVGGRKVPTVTPNDTVRQACHVLKDLNIGAAVVVDDGKLVGIFSERDVIRKCICGSRRTDETNVGEVMTVDPQTISITEPVAKALEAMMEGGFRHMPVLNGDELVGLLSMRDIPTENRLLVERYREYIETHVVA